MEISLCTKSDQLIMDRMITSDGTRVGDSNQLKDQMERNESKSKKKCCSKIKFISWFGSSFVHEGHSVNYLAIFKRSLEKIH